jgi:hypothetical protein
VGLINTGDGEARATLTDDGGWVGRLDALALQSVLACYPTSNVVLALVYLTLTVLQAVQLL